VRRKRPAETDPDGDQPLAKKFELLHIGSLLATRYDPTTATPSKQSTWSSESMILDDTEHVTYVHNLGRELEEMEYEERGISFLPDLEAKLTAIPKSVLGNPKPKSREMVLYRLPNSLTVSEERDNVKRAIFEYRERAQKRQVEDRNKSIADIEYADKDSVSLKYLNDSKACIHNNDAMDIDNEIY